MRSRATCSRALVCRRSARPAKSVCRLRIGITSVGASLRGLLIDFCVGWTREEVMEMKMVMLWRIGVGPSQIPARSVYHNMDRTDKDDKDALIPDG